ncbi:MAG: TlyA family rRNA (cytidine-2'-O)-methyltransferase [Phycisphaeraceae bacterium]|nr:MAG: TlyA family rRNA (cytidine-2'-O)-methyltransferase [Phycisphaeraceae bacterium]
MCSIDSYDAIVTGASTPSGPNDNPFVSRGGLKLRHALDAFSIDPTSWWAADLGCSTGGFTDCLLQGGAARVWSVDTAYGELAWKLRQDERVTVMERTNALHAEIPSGVVEHGGVDLVVIDLGWTPQAKAIPAALRWVRGGCHDSPSSTQSCRPAPAPSTAAPQTASSGTHLSTGLVITLIKPHYEVDKSELGPKGVLDPERAAAVVDEAIAAMPGLGVRVLGCVESPVLGGKKKGKGTGNKEWLAALTPG